MKYGGWWLDRSGLLRYVWIRPGGRVQLTTTRTPPK